MPRRLAAALAAAAVLVGGCANADEDRVVEGSTLSIYAGLPMEGPDAAEGLAIVNGAKLALADADGKAGKLNVVATYLGTTRGDPPRPSPEQAARNGRRAAQDARTIAYLGDFGNITTRVSLPISNQAGIAHAGPGATGIELTRRAKGAPPGSPERYYPSGERNFARVIPNDAVQAQAAARWARRLGARDVTIVRSHRDGFARMVADEFAAAAEQAGLRVTATAPSSAPGPAARDQPDLIYLAVEDPDPSLVRGLAEGASEARLMGPHSLLEEGFLRELGPAGRRLYVTSPALPASELPPQGRRFARRYRTEFGEPPNPYAAYGYEAMRLLVDSIRRAGEDGANRDEVIERMLATRNRDSVLGRYSIDGDGDTTLDRIAGYRVRGGRAVFDRVLRP